MESKPGVPSRPRRAYTFEGAKPCAVARRVPDPAGRKRASSSAASAVTDEWRLRHDASAQRMQALTERFGARRQQSRLLRHRHRWQEEAVALQKERRQADKELRSAMDALRRVGACEATRDEQYTDEPDAASFRCALSAVEAEGADLDSGRAQAARSLFAAVSHRRGLVRKAAADPDDLAEALQSLRELGEACGAELQSLAEVEAEASQDDSDCKQRQLTAPSAAELQRIVPTILAAADASAVILPHVDTSLRSLFEDALHTRVSEASRRVSAILETADADEAAERWEPAELDRFAAVCRAHWGGTTAPRQQLTDRLCLEFPTHRPAEVQRRLWVVERHRYLRRRCGAEVDAARRELLHMGDVMRNALCAASQLHEAREAAAQEQHQRDREREALSAKLAVLRQEREARDARKLEEELQLREEEQARIAKEEQRKEAEFLERLKKLAQHRERQRADEQRALALQAEAAELAMKERELRQQRNEERVAFRRAELQRRKADIENRREELARVRAEQERALAELAASVAPEVENDPLRHQRATAASAAPKGVAMLTHEQVSQERKLHGYSSAQVMKDKRFKLTEQLAQAGLLNTQYAREVIFGALPQAKEASRAMLGTTAANPMHVSMRPQPPLPVPPP